MGRHDFPLEGNVGANGSLSVESCGKSMEINVAHTSVLMILALFPREAGLFSSAPEKMATTR